MEGDCTFNRQKAEHNDREGERVWGPTGDHD